MKTDTLKKSLLDYAIKGKLTARFRRENAGLNAFDEISTYNDNIKQKRKDLEKELKKCEKELKLEKDKDKKAFFKSQIQMLKKELTKCKEITPLFCHTTSPCHTERSEVSQNAESKRDFSPTTQNAVSLENDNAQIPPFEIPNSWAWVKLGDIGEWKAGSTPSRAKPDFYVDGEILWLKTGDLNDDVVYHTEEKITKEAFNSYSMSFSDVGDILVAMYGATIGKTGIVGARMTTNQACCACKTNATIHNKYLFYFIQGRRDFIISQSFGTGQPNISKEKILNFLIPLPPLCEQQEIVKKLDLLVTLANDFAITKENLKRIEKRIEKSLLKLALEGSLSKLYRRNSPTLSAFDEISTYNEATKEKRKDLEKKLKICEKEFKLEKDKEQKAFLKSQIQMLKKELTKCKEITPLFNQSHEAGESEAPFTIPNSWAWVKLGDICEIFTGATPKTSNAENFGDFIPFLNPGDIDNNGNVIYSNRGLTEKGLKEARKIEANSILVVCIGGLIGKACLVDRECTCNQQINVAKPFFTEATLLYYFINSAYFQSTIKANSTGTATPIINKNLFEKILIPLPPLKEQEHIAQTLDTLFTLKKGLRVE
ncbi:restriction endonuclease subunit S [Helicobacter bilis]|uniref:restriction endonuclease subunit S n=3 Tax=Helicobacter bilis TaxID=37372 RepID=UPI00248DCA57|nr:restriction endonuclease subunit S [Helicobacter bilis]